ncbi:hypothetical protein M514_05603 [Trichuris suis]|uniref:Uncharacterized protein n=1 Tax=Trichuris suis TaxID=68888 RepID=A0A085NQT6_9BILA|nr:hypothetical protein M514_05603 [Trichuris suis]
MKTRETTATDPEESIVKASVDLAVAEHAARCPGRFHPTVIFRGSHFKLRKPAGIVNGGQNPGFGNGGRGGIVGNGSHRPQGTLSPLGWNLDILLKMLYISLIRSSVPFLHFSTGQEAGSGVQLRPIVTSPTVDRRPSSVRLRAVVLLLT